MKERKPYIGIEVVDSYGDRLLVNLTGKLVNDGLICLHNYVSPCPDCGLPVVDSSIVPESNGICDHCWNTVPDDTERILRTMDLCPATDDHGCQVCDIYDLCTKRQDTIKETNMEERIEQALYHANMAFWKEIVKAFPEANDGDFDPLHTHQMTEQMETWISHWVDLNVPKPVPRGIALAGINLHYLNAWHLTKSDIGCTVAVTDNVAVGGKHYYLAVDSKSVSIHMDDFKIPLLFNEQVEWFLGDNPTVLMNYIDEFMGGTGYWDTGKLFDDIMTIAKSNLV
jgi:hypothetical protein